MTDEDRRFFIETSSYFKRSFNPFPPAFFTKKTAFFTVKAVFSVLCCQIPPNFATKAFSYTLAKIRPLAGKSQGFP